MKIAANFLLPCLFLICPATVPVLSQSPVGTITGYITDQHNAVVIGATVIAKRTETGFVRSTVADRNGHYAMHGMPAGTYELTIEAATFMTNVQRGITLDSGQVAVVPTTLIPGPIRDTVTVIENASMLNRTTPELSTRFDSRRLSELPFTPNRSVYNILYSVPGVSQPSGGQTAFALGISFSANGGRIRSNNFMLDGQDLNDAALSGGQIPLNNPDAIQEVRIITGQFLAEHGHNSASVVNIVGKSGTNDLHGSLFWFHNNENLNACSNLDKAAGFCDPGSNDDSLRKAPPRRESQTGFTLGGPVIFPRFGGGGRYLYTGRNRTFFFTDYQRWTDRRSVSVTLSGAPTEVGRAELQTRVGNRRQVQELLRFVPAGIPNGQFRRVTVTGGGGFDVALGDLTQTSAITFESHQGSIRIDHLINNRNLIYARYRYSIESTAGSGQVTPAGHTASDTKDGHAAVLVWTALLTPAVVSEARVAWKRFSLVRDAANQDAKSIPSIQILDLGMIGTTENPTRTGFGLPTNLPVVRTNDTYQIAHALTWSKGEHSFKFGTEVRRSVEDDELLFGRRGMILYETLSNFVNDRAANASKTFPIPGGESGQYYRWHEFYAYAQDQWRVRPDLTLSLGVRYEYPGNSFRYLEEINERVLAANNNDPRFRFEGNPKADANNWMPRIGLSWTPVSRKGILGSLAGNRKMVLRGGYSRTYDAHPVNINQNIALGFPFSAGVGTVTTNAFATLMSTFSPSLTDLSRLNRVALASDFRAPSTDQFSIDIQRELTADLVVRAGYVHTRGAGLHRSVEGNPRLPCLFGTGPQFCNTTGIDRITGAPLPVGPPNLSQRLNLSKGSVNVRGNFASSIYDALQASLEKRLSGGLSFGVHYTWSTMTDTASDFNNVSLSDISGPQDPFNPEGDKARSAFDRPHRLSGNFVFELPFFRRQNGFTGKLLGGWQVNSFFNFQSGAPFTPLNGSDPTGTASAGLRPNVFTDLDISGMTVTELFALDRSLRTAATSQAVQTFNNLPPGPCMAGWLGGPPLPRTLFAAPRGRITCNGGQRSLVVDFIGVLEGQRIGNAGRNILRSDSLKLIDLGLIKNTQVTERVRAQFWIDVFNALNSRNFGVPSSVVTSPDFLNRWATEGGSRRIRLGARLVF